MEVARAIVILLIIIAICVVTWAIIWALAIINLYTGIPFILLIAGFLIAILSSLAAGLPNACLTK